MRVVLVEFSKVVRAEGIFVFLLSDDQREELAYFSFPNRDPQGRGRAIHKANQFGADWASEHDLALIPLYDCYGCFNPNTEYYMIHDDLWAEVATYGRHGMLCFDCLVQRLGRSLTQDDFTGAPVNNFLRQNGSPFLVHPYKGTSGDDPNDHLQDPRHQPEPR